MIETVSKLISINNLSDVESALTSHFKSRGVRGLCRGISVRTYKTQTDTCNILLHWGRRVETRPRSVLVLANCDGPGDGGRSFCA